MRVEQVCIQSGIDVSVYRFPGQESGGIADPCIPTWCCPHLIPDDQRVFQLSQIAMLQMLSYASDISEMTLITLHMAVRSASG